MFTIGLSTSFIFSLPIGVLNTSTAQISITEGYVKAFIFAITIALIESVQVLIAYFFCSQLDEIQILQQAIEVMAILLFLYLSFHYWNKTFKYNLNTSSKKTFLKGLKLSSLNFMAIPFWMAYFKLLPFHIDDLSWTNLLTNVLGIFVGTVLALNLYSILGAVVKDKLIKYGPYFNKVTAVVFLVSSIIITTKLFLNGSN